MKTAIDAPRGPASFLVKPEDISIIRDPKHPLYDAREKLPVDDAMVRNIMAYGVKQAVKVAKDGDKLVAVDGRQRVQNAVEANKRLVADGKEPLRVKVELEKGTEADLFGVTCFLNEFRQDDTVMGRAVKAKKLMDMNKPPAEIAVVFGVTESTVGNWIALLSCCAAVRRAVDAGKITPTAALRLSKLSAEDQEKALEEVGEGRGTAMRAAKVARRARAGGSEVERPSKKAQEAVLDVVRDGAKDLPPKDQETAAVYREVLEWVLEGKVSAFLKPLVSGD